MVGRSRNVIEERGEQKRNRLVIIRLTSGLIALPLIDSRVNRNGLTVTTENEKIEQE